METNEQTFKETESIKLIRNTKGYNYEIKILGTDIARLDALNEQMKALYGVAE